MYFFQNKPLFLVIPIFSMIADWAENYIELLMLKNYLNSNLISETLVVLDQESTLLNGYYQVVHIC